MGEVAGPFGGSVSIFPPITQISIWGIRPVRPALEFAKKIKSETRLPRHGPLRVVMKTKISDAASHPYIQFRNIQIVGGPGRDT